MGRTTRAKGAGTGTKHHVSILLSTYNGAAYLEAQLASLLSQTHEDWSLHWRDDGSTDATAAAMRRFAHGAGDGRVITHQDENGRLGVSASFFRLLRAVPDAPFVAFSDQDDVWLPEKLARGIAALTDIPADTPALYCARQVLVDARLRPLGLSFRLRREPGFPAALTQNLATGCTVMLNGAAARLVASSRPPSNTLHDWWSYLLVAAHGGALLTDDEPVVLYRQHPGNMVGAPLSLPRRAVAALRRGPGVFMRVMRSHVAALLAEPAMLAPEALASLRVIDAGLRDGLAARLRALRLPGMTRQTWQETALFYLWFLIG